MSGVGFTDIDPAEASANRGPSVVAVATIGIAVSTLAVVLRFWSRAVASTLVLWWDDWAMLLTILLSHAFLALDIYMTTVGLGRHAWAVPMENLPSMITAQRLGVVFYTATVWGIKISALLLYGRLFRTSQRFVMVLRVTGVVVTIWWLITAIYPWSFCDPIAKNIDPFLPGTCWENIPWYYASSFFNAFFDLVVLALPVPIIWRLRTSRRKKFAVTMVLLLGYCSAFLSFARFIIIAINPAILSVNPPADPSWDLVPLLYLSMLEGPIAIIALCGPAIHQLTSRYFNYGSLASLFTSRDRGIKPRLRGSDKGHIAGFSGLSNENPRTWPAPTFASMSSTTAIAEGDNRKDSGDWQNQPDVTAVPMAYLPASRDGSQGRRERDMV
ncbi:Rhodopsin domain-containing protein [Madurella fahalii]|uniref:Rhodopsin domain-containing protein n=1 Tax=Madurella fahalii TaxID=1157608 RepID=A0ABQ0G4Y4_9PEZI